MLLLANAAAGPATDALLAAAIAGAGVCVLASSMFVAYAARLFRKWRTLDGDAERPL